MFQESQLSDKYYEALRKIVLKEYTGAQEMLEEALRDPLISNIQAANIGVRPHLRELRLVKNSWLFLLERVE
jgi:flagellar biosynthesis/type III secretory pathway protein FliH